MISIKLHTESLKRTKYWNETTTKYQQCQLVNVTLFDLYPTSFPRKAQGAFEAICDFGGSIWDFFQHRKWFAWFKTLVSTNKEDTGKLQSLLN